MEIMWRYCLVLEKQFGDQGFAVCYFPHIENIFRISSLFSHFSGFFGDITRSSSANGFCSVVPTYETTVEQSVMICESSYLLSPYAAVEKCMFRSLNMTEISVRSSV